MSKYNNTSISKVLHKSSRRGFYFEEVYYSSKYSLDRFIFVHNIVKLTTPLTNLLIYLSGEQDWFGTNKRLL